MFGTGVCADDGYLVNGVGSRRVDRSHNIHQLPLINFPPSVTKLSLLHDDCVTRTGGALKLKGVNSAFKILKPNSKKREASQPAESSDTALEIGKGREKIGG